MKNAKRLRSQLIKHETKRNVLFRFLGVTLLVLLYFVFVAYKFGTKDGLFVTVLTWSFFVFCTPVADAGILLDLPIRLLTTIRMLYSEITVWVFSAIINILTLIYIPQIYDKTFLLRIFHTILTHPVPYWLIILLSAAGTFLSVVFGDELIDTVRHKDRKHYHRHRLKHARIILLFLFATIILLYHMVLTMTNLKL